MGNRKPRVPGPQHHAEGQHGEKTHQALVDQLQQGAVEDSPASRAIREGGRRLQENREQHDLAEQNSEKTEAIRRVRAGEPDDTLVSKAGIPRVADSD